MHFWLRFEPQAWCDNAEKPVIRVRDKGKERLLKPEEIVSFLLVHLRQNAFTERQKSSCKRETIVQFFRKQCLRWRVLYNSSRASKYTNRFQIRSTCPRIRAPPMCHPIRCLQIQEKSNTNPIQIQYKSMKEYKRFLKWRNCLKLIFRLLSRSKCVFRHFLKN